MSESQTTREWVTIEEATGITGRNKNTIIAAVYRRRVLAEKSGGVWLIYLPALLDYFAYTDELRATGNTSLKCGGPFYFCGHGKRIKVQK